MQISSTKIPGTYKELKREYISQAERLAKLEHQVEYFKKMFFGRKSEKSLPPDNQLTLDGILPEGSHETKTQEITGYQRTIKKAKPGKKPLPKDLPRKKVYHKPGDDEIHCHCGKQMEPFFEDVHEELNYIPPKMEVIEHIYPKYSCTDCHDKVVQACTINRPIEKGRPGPGLLAQVVVSKYEDHLPLDRQVKIFHRFKVDIAKSTMSHWIGCIYDLFTPIYDKMKERVLSSGYVLSDDTGIKVLDKNIKGKTHQGYIWSYGDLKQVVFHYTRTRSREGPKEFLNGYKGYLHTDGYSGYNESVNGNEITHIGCWSHARRKFYEIKDSEPEANELVKIIGKLFLVEKEAKERQLSYEGIKSLREQKSVPILKELKIRLDKMKSRYLPKSPMAGAITYALNQWDKLNVYVTDGRIEISNNFSERCIKTVVIGRKNWLFAGSHEGAKRSAMMFSLIESCKLLEINTWEYLNNIFSRINEHPVKMDDLTPLGWKKSRENQDGVN